MKKYLLLLVLVSGSVSANTMCRELQVLASTFARGAMIGMPSHLFVPALDHLDGHLRIIGETMLDAAYELDFDDNELVAGLQVTAFHTGVYSACVGE